MRVLIMAGGTGGHIFPALAVAKRLQQQNHTVHWLGAKHGMEARIATANVIPIHYVNVGGIRGKGWQTKLLAPWRLLFALVQSIFIIAKFNPDIVLGMGGYVTGPAGLATWLLRKRLVIHEQNAIAGMTNQILARFSYKVLEGFPHSFPNKLATKVTGNPVREDFNQLLPPQNRAQRDVTTGLKILIVGGSGGARTLNNIIPKLLQNWPSNVPQPLVWHQAGSKQILEARQAYENHGIAVNSPLPHCALKLVDFIHDMAYAYSWADLVICRSGALTVAELAAAGKASILIPYPYAVDDHQTKNAQYLAEANAAIIIQEKDLKVENLATILAQFTTNPDKLTAMSQAAYNLAKPDALDLVVANLQN